MATFTFTRTATTSNGHSRHIKTWRAMFLAEGMVEV